MDREIRVRVEKQKKTNNYAAVKSLLQNKAKNPHFQFQEFTWAFIFVIVNITNNFSLKFDKSTNLENDVKSFASH